MWYRDLTVHSIELPESSCLSILQILINSTKTLPQSLRLVGDFYVSFSAFSEFLCLSFLSSKYFIYSAFEVFYEDSVFALLPKDKYSTVRLSHLQIPDGPKVSHATLSRRALDRPCAVI